MIHTIKRIHFFPLPIQKPRKKVADTSVASNSESGTSSDSSSDGSLSSDLEDLAEDDEDDDDDDEEDEEEDKHSELSDSEKRMKKKTKVNMRRNESHFYVTEHFTNKIKGKAGGDFVASSLNNSDLI